MISVTTFDLDFSRVTPEQIRVAVENCLYRARRDATRPETLTYTFEFSRNRWDLGIVVRAEEQHD
jgi:hypothetical protein